MNLKKMIAVKTTQTKTVVTASARDKKQPTGMEDRQVWVNTLVKIADPVLSNLANNTLRDNMPQESLDTMRVHRFSLLEAVGRTLRGIAPWLELGLPATDPFWTEPFTPWTGLKAWNGEDVMADHAIGD